MQNKPQIAPEVVQEFVAVAHGDLARVTALLQGTPALVNAAWEWGGGDWESALAAASHVGRRDIALYLLEHGARMDIFAATMLGELEIVKAALQAFPAAVHVCGPHGIPLLDHAKMGGHAAMIALIESHLFQKATS